MAKRLTDAQRADFRDRGFAFPVRVMARAEADAGLRALEAAEAAHADLTKRARNYGLFRVKPHLLFTWLDRIVHHPVLLDAVEDLIGPDILVWSSSLFIKDARDPAYIAWHQDSYTYGLEGTSLVTAWVALTDATPENGAMRFLPGSHRLGRLAHDETRGEHDLSSQGETVRLTVDEVQAVDIVLRAGEASLHQFELVHSSNPNRSDGRRIGYAIRYFPPTMRRTGKPATVMLARGHAGSEWILEPRPRADEDAAARAAHAQAIGARAAEMRRMDD